VIEELTHAEIDAFLRRQAVGRIGCHADGKTYVVPVIYAWDGDSIFVQSVEGRKIRMMRANPKVVFEVDEYKPGGDWHSVIVEGVYEELESSRAEEALALLVQRFVGRRRNVPDRAGGRKPVTFRIRCTRATGRRVKRTAKREALTRLGKAANDRRARRTLSSKPGYF
jgi:nitroimidazol reductase NimA-like FMN-containing flavoprotein (pyridoxamine 5'-phosphate oxidase superfamily)